MFNFKFINSSFKNQNVLITGHTGFKGTWLTLIMLELKANVIGISNGYPSNPSLFKDLKLSKKIKNYNYDINNFKKIKTIIKKHKPKYIFHLAAQSIVLKSYKKPYSTHKTNIIGTLNILEIIKDISFNCSILFITSDKVYKNTNKNIKLNEDSPLGGDDNYSSSKACKELIINSYYESFLKHKKNISISTARGGNVIGGGDWTENRLFPDIYRNPNIKKILIRNPNHSRPWQNIFECLNGYINLILYNNFKRKKYITFNFGPTKSYHVKYAIKILEKKSYFSNKEFTSNNLNVFKNKEKKYLNLNSSKSKKILKLKEIYNLNESLDFLHDWYTSYNKDKKNVKKVTDYYLKNYFSKII